MQLENVFQFKNICLVSHASKICVVKITSYHKEKAKVHKQKEEWLMKIRVKLN